ncbi:MAG: 3'(2'),5'-bisphosphate nucleotidase CysQ [Gemmataceae bacterium]|nr:3'(2'),5'-bisphosphate nucleotidase CysQ [Gemmataceae bacterium]
MNYTHELQAALDAARLAAEALREAYARFQVIPDAPASISTDADRQSQEIILTRLQHAFPQDGYCAEEQTPALAGVAHTGPRLWVIDPIDGTRGFARKNGEFSVMIGFVEQGQIAVGVVLQPVPGRLTYAVRGQGCWKRDSEAEPVPCRVTDVSELKLATLTQSHSTPGKRSRRLELLAPGRVVESYSAGIKLALVARGEADLYVNTYPEFHDWDSCAGQILVEEAGGRVTGLNGEELRYGLPGAAQRFGLLATNSRLHEEAIERMAPLRSG